MPTAAITGAITGISTGLLAIGLSLLVLTLAAGGICMYFSWMDTHMGGLIKKILISSLLGSTLLGSSGALGIWLGGLFGLGGAAPAAAGMIVLSLIGG